MVSVKGLERLRVFPESDAAARPLLAESVGAWKNPYLTIPCAATRSRKLEPVA